ncbi:MAG: KH domain-containing protein [Armatimonadetes bacterium]|nr:KH domain-containing protein [Armatimonadota bacterium]
MHEIELRAKSLEEARKAAAFQLGVTPEDIEIEVLEEPRGATGELLGATYRVRARIKGDAFAPRPSEQPELQESEEEIDITRFTLSGGQTGGRGAEQEPAPVPKAAAGAPDALASEVVAEKAREFLNGLMRVWGIDARAEIRRVDPDEVVIELVGEELAVLIGRYGSTLDALQTVTAAVANRGVQQGARVVLDAQDYRERRREALERLARSTAAKVKRTGQQIALPNLQAHERRIIHLALRDDPAVETYSEGEGFRRRLIVAPRRQRPRERRQ